MKYIGIDYGLKRVGLSASDAGGGMAFARRTLKREERAAFFAELLEFLAEENAEAIVLGLPRHLDGSESLTTRQALNFAASLKRRTEKPIYLMEEYLSSAEAETMLKSAGYSLGNAARQKGNQRKAQKEQGRIDSLAAARILESFLALPEEQRQERLFQA